MSPVKGLNLLNDPLQGTNLTEASAGTGKTYTITGLFLRLVLEKRLSVNQILVVTFTEAATQELKERIRNGLRQAMDAFSGKKTQDTFLDNLVNKHRQLSTCISDLTEALRAFDQAAIFTIHGFCRKVLLENAFESGSLFDTEMIADQEEIKGEIVRDFWRKNFCDASPLFVHHALSCGVTPDSLLALIGNRASLPYLKIVPAIDVVDTWPHEQQFKRGFDQVRHAWDCVSDEVKDILLNSRSLSKVTFRPSSVKGWIRRMEGYLASDGHDPLLFEGFEKFTNPELERATKKGHRVPSHRFFDLCDMLLDRRIALTRALDQRLLGLKVALFRFVQSELYRRKEQNNVQSFDDLLLKLHQGLRGKAGALLARTVRAKYKAALIDEFQDTDPIQYEIFEEIFGSEPNMMFLVGDPKQAIYGFRSADVFTYMKAAENVTRRYTLYQNWRSVPDLIDAVNTLFASAQDPFVYRKIGFQPAKAARKTALDGLRIDGKAQPPFHVWLVKSSQITDGKKPVAKSQARPIIAKAVAGEISRLLHLAREDRAMLEERPLSAEDIAVLVRRNREARLVKEALSEFNIPSVLHSTGNLFETHEAFEVERLLASVLEPANEALLKAAMCTDMIGFKGEDLEALSRDDNQWEEWVVRFKAYFDLWAQHGVMQMLCRFMDNEKVMARLMTLTDGERRTTNVLHLCDVLHKVSMERNLSMGGLLKWLLQQRDPDTPRLEEHQLLLESDERAVKIVTAHKSKGLEYPIVFCPFAWDGSRMRNKKGAFAFHDETRQMRLTVELGSKNVESNRACAERECLAENVRLLYVALTRATSRCYLVWGRFNEAETSAPAYLFHQPQSRKVKDLAKATAERFVTLNDEDIVDDLQRLAGKASRALQVSQMPVGNGRSLQIHVGRKQQCTCRTFAGRIDRSWQIASFSSLISLSRDGANVADPGFVSVSEMDANIRLDQSLTETPDTGIFAFPKGTRAGTFVHSIFEDLDFAENDASVMEKLVADKLSAFGYEASWQGTLCQMIRKVLSASLDGDGKPFTLSRVARKDRLSELEFYFPLRGLREEDLNNILARFAASSAGSRWPERIDRLAFSPVKGFMKGFIDLVFEFENRYYLVDWKTNFLGARVEDYGQEALAGAMEKGFYQLQYLLYTVALHQYLRHRLPGYAYEKHFGRVFYIFVRGVDPEKGSQYGIYTGRPSVTLVDELTERLIDCQ